MKLAPFILLTLTMVGCNLPFDTAPNTPASARKKTSEPTDAPDARPAPSSPFVGYRFFFDKPLPNEWQVTSRGDDRSLAPGYTALCVVSRKGGSDKVQFLLASAVDAAAREEVAQHMEDVDWWQPRIPQSFFDADRASADTRLHITKGQFAVDSMLVFIVLRCQSATCETSVSESHEFGSRLRLQTARADDEHVVSPIAEDCGSRF